MTTILYQAAKMLGTTPEKLHPELVKEFEEINNMVVNAGGRFGGEVSHIAIVIHQWKMRNPTQRAFHN